MTHKNREMGIGEGQHHLQIFDLENCEMGMVIDVYGNKFDFSGFFKQDFYSIEKTLMNT